MKPMPSVAWAMTPFPYAVATTDTIATASAMMEEHGIRHLPVTRDGDLVGVVSAEDLNACRTAVGVDVGDRTIVSLCEHAPYVVDIADRLDIVVEAMAERHAHAAVVLKRGKLAGILTTRDVCRAFATYLHRAHPDPENDGVA